MTQFRIYSVCRCWTHRDSPVTLNDIIMHRLYRSKEAEMVVVGGDTVQRQQSFRGHCAYRRTHATRCIISRNGTLTPCLWSPLRRKEPHKADERRCLRKTDKLLEPRKGNEFCRYGIEIAGLVFPAVKTNGWTRSQARGISLSSL